MTHVNGIGLPPEGGRENLAGETFMPAFCSKVLGGGDFASECMALMAEDGGLQMEMSRQGADLQQRFVREAREKRRELIRKMKEASEDSGFWSCLTDVFSKITTVLTTALTIFGGPAATVGLVGAAVSGGCGLFKAGYDRKFALAQASKLKVEEFKQNATGSREENAEFLERAVQLEHRMIERVRGLVDSQPDVILDQGNGRSYDY